MVSLLPQIIWNSDELNADPALIPTYLISKQARKNVKVVLSGEGADELFGGYERTMMMSYAWRTARICPPALSLAPHLINLIPLKILDKVFKYSSSVGSKGLQRLSQFCGNIHNNVGGSYLDVASVFNQGEKKAFYGPLLQQRLKDENIDETIQAQYFPKDIQDGEELFSRLSYLELKTRLPNDLLAKVDTMTMSHSLEARVPYLDHTFVDYAFSVPSSLKIRYFREKYILRQAALRYLPKEIVTRRKDHFFVPIHLWLQDELRKTIDTILSPENLAKTGYINSEYISKAYADYKSGSLFYARQIWNVLFFMIWHKMYIETDLFLSIPDKPLTLHDLFTKER
jgi:asparagine synthase (glutamine-hydrolysing)